jgi:hypothetical protein
VDEAEVAVGVELTKERLNEEGSQPEGGRLAASTTDVVLNAPCATHGKVSATHQSHITAHAMEIVGFAFLGPQ